jgi:Helicase HerA, central domain
LSTTENSKVGRVVSTDQSPTFDTIDVRLDPGKTVLPGQLLYAIVDHRGEEKTAILRVSGGQEHNEYETPLNSQVRDTFHLESSRGREDLLRKYVVVGSQPIDVLVKKDGGYITEDPTFIIPAGSEVFEDVAGLTGQVLGFEDPAAPGAMVFGTTVGGGGVTVAMSANKILPRHSLIVGSTGTGKSYLAGVQTEELKKQGIRHVNIDVHGELIIAAKELGGTSIVPGKDLTVKLSSLQEPELLNMLPLVNELHIDIVSKAFLNLKAKGQEFGIREFRAEAMNVAAGYGVRQNTLDIVDARIDTLSRVRILGQGVDWAEALKGEGAFVNVDCRDIGHSELMIVVAAVARELMTLRKRGTIPPLVLSMDEAHMFLPAASSSASSQVLAEIIRFGRHFGMGIIISTQSPGDIDRQIARITNTRFIFAIEPSELNAIAGLLSDCPPELIRSIPRLPVGTCLMVGSRETVRHAQLIRIRARKTTHGGQTPSMLPVPAGV